MNLAPQSHTEKQKGLRVPLWLCVSVVFGLLYASVVCLCGAITLVFRNPLFWQGKISGSTHRGRFGIQSLWEFTGIS